jgi:hypothetical protein
MTKADFITAVEQLGMADVEVKIASLDAGCRIGVAVQGWRDGLPRRNAVILPSGANAEEAFPALLAAIA